MGVLEWGYESWRHEGLRINVQWSVWSCSLRRIPADPTGTEPSWLPQPLRIAHRLLCILNGQKHQNWVERLYCKYRRITGRHPCTRGGEREKVGGLVWSFGFLFSRALTKKRMLKSKNMILKFGSTCPILSQSSALYYFLCFSFQLAQGCLV